MYIQDVKENISLVLRLYENGEDSEKILIIGKDKKIYSFNGLRDHNEKGEDISYEVRITNQKELENLGYEVTMDKDRNIHVKKKTIIDKLANKMFPYAGKEKIALTTGVIVTLASIIPVVYFWRKIKLKNVELKNVNNDIEKKK